MGILQRLFGRTTEHPSVAERRASGSGFTAEIMAARERYISGRRGLRELTVTVQACIGRWEAAFAIAKGEGRMALDRR